MSKYSKNLKPAANLILVYLALCTCSCSESSVASPQEADNNHAESFGTEAAVPIFTKLDDKMFPASWLVPNINATAKPVSSRVRDNGIAQIRSAMKKYPSNLLENDLERLYVVGKLQFSGISAGGTNSLRRLYLCVRTKAEGYSDQYIEGTFHHEFSSILLRNRGTQNQKKSWAAANPKDYVYEGNGTAAVANGKESVAYDAALAKDGFFSLYSKASYEEDFNIIATALFLGREELWKSAKQFPPMQKKLNLTIDFYESIDPTMNESFFQGLRE